MCLCIPDITVFYLSVPISEDHNSLVFLRFFLRMVTVTNGPWVKSSPMKDISFKHFTCDIWNVQLPSLSQLPTPDMTIQARVEAKLQCSGAFSLEADLPSVSLLQSFYLFPPLLIGPKLDGSSEAWSKSADWIGGETFVQFFVIFKCLYFVQPIK